jgi:hypothetical protein
MRNNMFDLNEYIKSNKSYDPLFGGRFTRHIRCVDGYKVSVQVGTDPFGKPYYARREGGRWVEVEVYFFDKPVPIDYPWGIYDDGSGLCKYVPVEVVERLVEDHGGLK